MITREDKILAYLKLHGRSQASEVAKASGYNCVTCLSQASERLANRGQIVKERKMIEKRGEIVYWSLPSCSKKSDASFRNKKDF